MRTRRSTADAWLQRYVWIYPSAERRISRSGFSAWGVELARKANLTLIGRARGKRFVALAGESRIVFDQDLAYVEEESAKHRRKAAVHDD